MEDTASVLASTKSVFVVNIEIGIVRDGRYLMIVRGDEEEFGAGWLCFPGGTVDWTGPAGDIIEETARREALEEVGMPLRSPIVYVESHTFGDDAAPCLDVVVLARPEAGADPAIVSPGEVAALAWMTAGEILADERAQPWTRASLARAEAIRRDLAW